MSEIKFPSDFIWGASSAAYQIEGSSNGNCGPCHWDTFAATPKNVFKAENGSTACDHFHRFEEDLDLNDSVHKTRASALKVFEDKGFPSKKEEAWKYTSLEALIQKDLSLIHI